MTNEKEQAAKQVEEWDTIVIGSGMGGMAAASLLSQCQENHRVLVLEQNPDHAGGCCQDFERNGYRFGVGLHYVGDMSSDKSTSKKLVDALTPESDPIEWSKLPDNFDTIMIGTKELRRYDHVAHRQKKSLVEQFPDEEQAIEKFFDMMYKAKKAAERSFVLKCLPRPLLSFLVYTRLYLLFDGGFHKYANMTVSEVTESLTENEDLRAVMGYIGGDYGEPPDKAPFAFHALVYLGYGRGACYPTNGPGIIPQKISKAIESCGGEVRINSPVRQILVDGGRATGVELNDGTHILTNKVVSDVGFINTFQNLVPMGHQPAYFSPRATPTLKNGVTGTDLFVGLRGNYDNDFHLPHTQLWAFPESKLYGKPFPDSLKELYTMNAEEVPMLFITVPCAKDQAWKSTFPNKTTLEIMSTMPYKAFSELLDENGELRDDKKEEYEHFKRTFGQLVWTRARQVLLEAGASTNLPERLDDADVAELGTPLTYVHYLGRSAWLGLDHGVERFHPKQWYVKLRPECKIKGLYLTGQDVSTCGVGGALVGGYICAAKIMGEKNPFDLTEKISTNRAK